MARAPRRRSAPAVPVTLRERKRQALRDRTYRAAIELFMAKGYEATTVDEIAAAADIGRATFFNHYPSKDAILHELAREAVAYAAAVFEAELAQGTGSLEKRLKASLGRFAEIVERNPGYYQSIFLDIMRSQARFEREGPRDAVDLVRILAAHLRAEQKRGTLDPRLDATQLSEILTGAYMYTILAGIQGGLRSSLVARMHRAVELVLRGCGPVRRRR